MGNDAPRAATVAALDHDGQPGDAAHLAAMAAAWDHDGRWREVPRKVAETYARVAPEALKVAACHAGEPGRVYWHARTGSAWIYRAGAIEKGAGAPADRRGAGRQTPPDPCDHAWLLVKRADGEYLRPVADAYAGLQRPLGGPNPLTASLVGGAIGSGLGYAGGWALEKVLPEHLARRGPLKRTLGVLGGLAGAAPGLAWGATNMTMPGDTGGGAGAWTSGFPFKRSRFDGLDPGGDLALRFAKYADAVAGSLYLPTIPVDAFNNAVWADVHSRPSPWGTKSPYGTDEEPLGTPPPIAAAASGIVAGASAASGGGYVSPWQVGLTAAASAGKGYAAGLAVGKVFGALAGLTPEAQGQLRQMGLWGGLVSGAVRTLFN